MSFSRRTFLERTAAVAAAGFIPRILSAEELESLEFGAKQSAGSAFRGRPLVVSSANGIRGVKVAYDMIVKGEDPLDAAIEGVKIQELDPNDQSVGYGGLPNADGVVQLDASCMHGPTKRAGAVGCLEGIKTPSLVAKAIMDYTDHIMLVGEGAKRFAIEMGFKEETLLTEKSRQDWLRWRANLNKGDAWLDRTGDVKIKFTTGTINMNAVTGTGDIASITTTSGMSWKIPGRVGDSPIIGAGQYCDNTVGACGSTGRGESNIMACGAMLGVEFMRQGIEPETAMMKVMERVIALTEKRLLGDNGRPKFDLNFYALTKDGRFAGACAYEGSSYAVCDAAGPRLVKSAFLYKESERPKS